MRGWVGVEMEAFGKMLEFLAPQGFELFIRQHPPAHLIWQGFQSLLPLAIALICVTIESSA
jgi:hypothetical protein